MTAEDLGEFLQGYVLKILDVGGATVYRLEDLKTDEVYVFESFQQMMIELEESIQGQSSERS